MNKKVKSDDKVNFYEKMKKDKRYSAKVQFIGYGIFILLIIIFLNVTNMRSNVENTVDDILDNQVTIQNSNSEEEVSLLGKLNNNYQYDINISLVKNDEEFKYHYYGKSYDSNIDINREFDGVLKNYYKVDDYYYIKNESNEYELVSSNVIYDLVDGKYIEVGDLLSLINKASLNHVLNSSTGNKEEVYNLLVRDLVISNKSDDYITINVIEEEDKLLIEVDYTSLLKVFDNSISSCKISYVYTNIGNVEEFNVMEKNN